jgi:hypothetical protein
MKLPPFHHQYLPWAKDAPDLLSDERQERVEQFERIEEEAFE